MGLFYKEEVNIDILVKTLIIVFRSDSEKTYYTYLCRVHHPKNVVYFVKY